MKSLMMSLVALFLVNTATASQVAEKNTFECVEVKVNPLIASCKALTVNCLGGFLLKVNGIKVDSYLQSPLAEEQCQAGIDLAKDVVHNKDLIQDVMLNLKLVKETLVLAK